MEDGKRDRRSGYTLVELLLVATILAIVAGTVLLSYEGTDDVALQSIARTELNEIRKAILQFRLDTGYLPKTGPFELVERGGLVDPSIDLHWPVGAPQDPDDRRAWFHRPENFYQLFFLPAGTLAFDPDRRRGWRGPYLSRHGEGWVEVGGPAPVPGVADPFPQRNGAGTTYVWTELPSDPDSRELQLGRPYSFDVDTNPPCLLCLGPNDTDDRDDLMIQVER